LRRLARAELKREFDELVRAADRAIRQGPTPEPKHLGSVRDRNNEEMIKYWWPNREQTLRACQEAEVLAFVYLITQDRKYGEAARRWVMHLASWNPDGPTNFALNCEAAKPMLHRPARAYDWAYDVLSETDREVFRRVMLRRISDAWKSGEVQQGVGHLNRPYNSHGNRTWHKIGEAAIALYGEVPEAEVWLDYVLNKFYACYPVWADEDGGWHEGLSYWAGYMSKAVWWLDVAQTALRIDGFKKPFFHQVGDFALYVAPPGSPNCGFGDLSYRTPSQGWGGFLEYFIRQAGRRDANSHAAYWHWWAQQWRMDPAGGILGFLYRARLSPPPPPKPPADLPQSKIFRGIGVASLHVTLLDSSRDVHLLFKASQFGSRSHGHNPQNSFQLNAFGEALLTTCVYRDLHGSRFHYGWAHSTVAHNVVLIGQEGQLKHRPDPLGQIVASDLTERVDYLCGDATAAYAGKAKKALRHILFARLSSPADRSRSGQAVSALDSRVGSASRVASWTPPSASAALPAVILIVDELEANEPTTFQFMLHALSPFAIDPEKQVLYLERPKAGLIAQYLPDAPLGFRQWDGYDPPPRDQIPNQWHVEASTQEKKDAVTMLTLLIPYPAASRPQWSARRVESADAVGLEAIIGGKSLQLAIRKASCPGPAVWQAQTFPKPYFAKF